MRDAMNHLGRSLRKWADRVDPGHAPRYASPWSFTIERQRGVVFNENGRGCPVMYATNEYERAFTEAAPPPPPFNGGVSVGRRRRAQLDPGDGFRVGTRCCECGGAAAHREGCSQR